MFQITQEEIGEIIDITEEMCNLEGWTEEALPLAQKRMAIIEKARSRPSPSPSELAATAYQAGIECGREDASAQAREDVLKEAIQHLESKREGVLRVAADGYPMGILDGTISYLESLRTGGDE